MCTLWTYHSEYRAGIGDFSKKRRYSWNKTLVIYIVLFIYMPYDHEIVNKLKWIWHKIYEWPKNVVVMGLKKNWKCHVYFFKAKISKFENWNISFLFPIKYNQED